MSDLSDVPTDELERELAKRRPAPMCPTCRGKWQTYVGAYDVDGYTTRCHGCLRAVPKCTCR